jgi:prepilin-type N-terminal cleavage/methylation domain-containing protein
MMKKGFTLIELLVVIVILGLLITLGSKALRAAKLSAKKAQALVEMKSIETAVNGYYAKYGKLPAASSLQGNADVGATEDESRDTILILTAEDTTLNPAEIVFLEPQGAATDGRFLDPWGMQYLIALDTDYDGEVDLSGAPVRRKVAVVAVGLADMKGNSDTNDWVISW